MSTFRNIRLPIISTWLISAMALPGAVFIKSNNATTDLGVVGSWTSGSAVPGAYDIARFDSTVNSTIAATGFTLNSDRTWLGIQVRNPGANITISGTGTLTLGGTGDQPLSTNEYYQTSSIEMRAATVDLTINNNLAFLANSSQIWNVPTARTLTLGGTAITRNAGSTLNVRGAGTVTATGVAALVNDATGIIAPWGTRDIGVNTRYLMKDGSNNLVAYTGTSSTVAAIGATPTANYEVTAAGTFGAGASFNTLRYTGVSAALEGTGITANGILNAGSTSSSTLTINSNVKIGDDRELVLLSTADSLTSTTGYTGNIAISGVVSDNDLGASRVTVSGNNWYNANNVGGISLVTLSGNNTYTGETVVNSGTLVIRHNNALGATGAGAGTTIYTATRGRLQLENNITVAEALTFTGGDPNNTYHVNLYNNSGTNTVTGLITLAAPMRIGSSGSTTILNIQGGITTSNSSGIVWNMNTGTVNITGGAVNLGTGGFNSDQAGTINLGTTGNVWGATSLSNSTRLNTTVSGALPASNLYMGVTYGPLGGTLDVAGTTQSIRSLLQTGGSVSTITSSVAGGSLTLNQLDNVSYTGLFTGSLALTKNGTSTLRLFNDSTHTGDTTIGAGNLQIDHVAQSVVSSSTLTTSAVVTVANASGLVVGQLVTGANIPADTRIHSISGNSVTLSRTPTSATTLDLTFGTLHGALSQSTVNYNTTGGNLVFGPGTTATELGGLKGNKSLALTNTATTPASVALSLGANGQSNEYSGVLSGGGSINKTGSGTQIFSGNSTYSGGTTVTNGKLFANNTAGSATGSGAVTVKTGATIGGNGFITTVAGLIVEGGGTLAAGGTGPDRFTVNANVTLSSAANFDVKLAINGVAGEGDGTSGTSLLTVAGSVSLSNSVLTGDWAGNGSNLYDGTGLLTANQKLWVLDNDGTDVITGMFANANTIDPSISSIFGAGFTPYSATVDGQQFAVFYNADFTSGNLNGGNDIAMVAIGAVPEPSRVLLLMVGIAGFVLRRRRP